LPKQCCNCLNSLDKIQLTLKKGGLYLYSMTKKEPNPNCSCKEDISNNDCECEKKESKAGCACEEKNTEVDELVADLKRVQAEFENYQKRTEREFISRDERNKAHMLLQSLTVLDALNEGIKHETKNDGLVKVKEIFVKFLHNNGVQKMTTKVGDQFDHDEMECIMQGNEKDKKDGEILEVLQEGYFINDKVLRFAKVKVNKICETKENKKDENEVEEN